SQDHEGGILMLVLGLLFIILAIAALCFALGLFGKNEKSEAAKRLEDLFANDDLGGELGAGPDRDYGPFRKYTPAGAVDKAERNVVLAGRPKNWTVAKVLSSKVMFGALGLAF